jgi:nucleotide-binding universal stress UspA family protein
MPPAGDVRLVVGFDGSPPAAPALEAAVNLLQGRDGRIEVVYVAHIPSMAALSPSWKQISTTWSRNSGPLPGRRSARSNAANTHGKIILRP